MGTTRADALTLTIDEAAARLGISRTLAYELAAGDKLPVPAFRLGVWHGKTWPPRPAMTSAATIGAMASRSGSAWGP